MIVITQYGSGHYAGAEVGAVHSCDRPAYCSPALWTGIQRVSPMTVKKITNLAHELHNFTATCASKAKNIADTGKKRLSYIGPDGLSAFATITTRKIRVCRR